MAISAAENAVKTQIWCAIATYVLIASIKKEMMQIVTHYTRILAKRQNAEAMRCLRCRRSSASVWKTGGSGTRLRARQNDE
jgi:hypothetical protein